MADFGTLIGSDWKIDRSTKIITYEGDDHGVGAETYATVIDFHRWLQSLADDAIATASTEDELDITNTDPSRRSTDNIITLINGYTISETANNATEHLYDGSIIMDGGNTIYDGIVNFGNSDVVIQVLQDGAILSDDWWNLATGVGVNANAAAGISHRFMVKTRDDGVDIDGRRLIGTTRVMDTTTGTDHFTFGEFKINGTARGNNVLALTNSDDLNNSTAQSVIAAWADITFEGSDLDLIDIDADGTDEEYFTIFDTSGTHGQNDYYEYAKWLVRDGSASTVFGVNGEVIRGITHNSTFGTDGISPSQGDKLVWGTYVNVGTITGTFQVGEVIWDGLTTISDSTYLGRILAIDAVDESMVLYLESGVAIGNTAPIEGATSTATATTSADPTEITGGGELLLLAVDDDGATGEIYYQVLKGTAPGNTTTLYDDADLTTTMATTTVATPRTVSTPWIGVSTGSNIIGAYGIGFETDQVNDGDTLTALDGNTYSRPNLVTNTVSGLSQDGDDDRVLVATWDTDSTDVGNGVGYDINGDPVIMKDQMTTNALLSTSGITSIVITDGQETSGIPTDTPSTGTIRIVDDNGYERLATYTAWTGSTFTVNSIDFDGITGSGTYQASAGNSVYVTYIDANAATTSLTFQSTYDTDRSLVALVRNGDSTAPIKQFIAEWSLTSSNQTLGAIRTTDL